MVIISQRDFNRDLDEYLNKRFDKDREDFFSKVKKKMKIKKKKELPEKVDLEREEPKIEVVKETTPEEEEFEEDIKRPGFFQWLFGKTPSYEEEDVYEEEVEEEKSDEYEDIKQTIKILHKWLEKLPPEKINQFKRSEDFQKYKESLDRLGLIKK